MSSSIVYADEILLDKGEDVTVNSENDYTYDSNETCVIAQPYMSQKARLVTITQYEDTGAYSSKIYAQRGITGVLRNVCAYSWSHSKYYKNEKCTISDPRMIDYIYVKVRRYKNGVFETSNEDEAYNASYVGTSVEAAANRTYFSNHTFLDEGYMPSYIELDLAPTWTSF